MKRACIYFKDILDREYYEVTEFKYDYDTKRITYKDEDFKPKLESLEFKVAFDYNFKFIEFNDVIYYLAMKNTPEPEKEVDILTQPILEWLEKSKLTVTTNRDIILQALGGKTLNLTNRQLEMRVSGVLKGLGWRKSRRSSGVLWIKES